MLLLIFGRFDLFKIDLQSKKAEVAARAVHSMNHDVKVECLAERVGGDTEHVFTDTFFSQLHGVANALDNVEAREWTLCF